MRDESLQKITLENIANGAAPELFDRELDEVMKNISNLNMDAKKTRSITLKVTFTPNKDRTSCDTTITCSSSMAPVRGVDSSMLLGKEDGELKAYKTYEQLNMFEENKVSSISPN